MSIEMTVSEIAEVLGVSRQAVNNRVKQLPEEDTEKNAKGSPLWGFPSRCMRTKAWRALPKAPGISNPPPAGTAMLGLRAITEVWPTTLDRSTPWRTATRSLTPRSSARAPMRCSMWGRLKKRISPAWAGAARI